jgi:hypothetical protein
VGNLGHDITRNSVIYTGHLTLSGRQEMQTEFMWGNLLQNDDLEDQQGEGNSILRWKYGMTMVDSEMTQDRALLRTWY